MRNPPQEVTVGPLCSMEETSRVSNAVISEKTAIWLLSFNSSLSSCLFLYTRNFSVFLATHCSLSESYYKVQSTNDR